MPLTRKLFALVDAADFEVVNAHVWSANARGYATTLHGDRSLLLHNFLLGSSSRERQIDHINRDRLDNRRQNLTYVTRIENRRNSTLAKNNTSTYRGVSRHSYKGWVARIGSGAARKYLGVFTTAEAAARAYDKSAREHYGMLAQLNFPHKGSP